MARPDFPFCEFRFFPRWSLSSGGGGAPPMVVGRSNVSLGVCVWGGGGGGCGMAYRDTGHPQSRSPLRPGTRLHWPVEGLSA